MELKKDLEDGQATIDELTLRLITFEAMKRETIRLTAAAQPRDIMLAAMLHSVGEATVSEEGRDMDFNP
jgi:hypothetical protein